MKNRQLILSLCFFLMAVLAQAQPQRGSVLIGGNAGFVSTNPPGDDNNITIVSLSPLAGFFVTDRLAVGASVSLGFYGGDAEGSAVGLEPFLRYYFNGTGNARFFGQGNVAWQSFDLGEDFDARSSFGFGLGLGFDYFLNQHVALEAIVGYDNLKGEDDDDPTNTFGLTIGVAAFIGGGSQR